MHNDSIDTLLLRHYGHAAPAPTGLETQLLTSVRHEAKELRQQKHSVDRWRQQRVSRRQALRLFAASTQEAGFGMLSVGLEALSVFEAALVGQDIGKAAHP